MKIDKVEFGCITIDGQRYPQVLIIDGGVICREEERLRALFGTTHKMGDWEKKKLLSGDPDCIIIANGYDGLFQISDDFIKTCQESKINLIIEYTPEAVEKFGSFSKRDKRINALIHTTC